MTIEAGFEINPIETDFPDNDENRLSQLNDVKSPFEPASKEIRTAFAQLSRIRTSILFKMFLALAPILLSISMFYLSDTSIRHCFVYGSSSSDSYNISNWKPIEVSACIESNNKTVNITTKLDRSFNLTKTVIGAITFIFGFYIISRLLQDAKLAVQMIPYKIIVKCNRSNKYTFAFFGMILGLAVGATCTIGSYPQYVGKWNGKNVFFTDHPFPASQTSFIQLFMKYILLMGSLYSILLALIMSPIAFIMPFHHFLYSGLNTKDRSISFIDFSQPFHEVNAQEIYKAVDKLNLKNEKDEKKKYIEVLVYLNEHGKLQQHDPANYSRKNLSRRLGMDTGRMSFSVVGKRVLLGIISFSYQLLYPIH